MSVARLNLSNIEKDMQSAVVGGKKLLCFRLNSLSSVLLYIYAYIICGSDLECGKEFVCHTSIHTYYRTESHSMLDVRTYIEPSPLLHILSIFFRYHHAAVYFENRHALWSTCMRMKGETQYSQVMKIKRKCNGRREEIAIFISIKCSARGVCSMPYFILYSYMSKCKNLEEIYSKHIHIVSREYFFLCFVISVYGNGLYNIGV